MNREAAEHIVDEYTKAVLVSHRCFFATHRDAAQDDAEKLRECLIEHLVLRPSEPTKTGDAPIEIHEPLCLDEALCKAYDMGKKAYLDGLPCEPTLDDGVQNMCLYLSIEQSGKMMSKWRAGWYSQVPYTAPVGPGPLGYA
jgi:hypothetical protein